MKIVLQVSGETGYVRVDGKELQIKSGEPFEVPVITGTDFDAAGFRQYTIPDWYVLQEIMHNLWYLGIVEVPFTRDGFKMIIDETSAREAAKKAFVAAKELVLSRYVRAQQERVQQGSPANPPNGRALAIIKEHGIDIQREYGLNPAGFGVVAGAAEREDRLRAEAEARIAAVEKRYEEQLAKIMASISQTGKPKGDPLSKVS